MGTGDSSMAGSDDTSWPTWFQCLGLFIRHAFSRLLLQRNWLENMSYILVSRLVAVHEFQPIMIAKITVMFHDRRNNCCSR